MSPTVQPAPVRKTLVVQATVQRAFEAFTGKIGSWWPSFASIGSSPQADVILEPRAGGRWYERGTDGSECEWGKVLTWDPPSRVVLAWQVNGNFRYDPTLITEVEILFTAVGERATRVDLEHRHLERLGENAAGARDRMEPGWHRILDAYAGLVGQMAQT